MGLLTDAPFIRQLINHNNFLINNKLANIASQQIKLFDFVSVSHLFFASFLLIFRTFKEVIWEMVQKKNYRDFVIRKMFKMKKIIKQGYEIVATESAEEDELPHYVFIKTRHFYYFKRRRRKSRLVNYKKKMMFYKRLTLRFLRIRVKYWRREKKTRLLKTRKVNFWWGVVYCFDILPFASIPSYLEMNYRIFVRSLIKLPTFKNVTYPFRINKYRLPSISYKF